MTLIEVVAGLALMGTLIAAALTAKAQYTRQQMRAQRVLEAVALTDNFLLSYAHNYGELEQIGSGVIGQGDNLVWTARQIDEPSAGRWYCKVLRLQVKDVAGSADETPLVSVDLLLPDTSAIPRRNESGAHIDEYATVGDRSRNNNQNDVLEQGTIQTDTSSNEGK